MKKYDKGMHKSIFILLLLLIGIGYAALTSNLDMAGSTKITGNTWDIHFNNVQVTNGSVEATSPATINPTNNTSITYSIELDLPGDFYEFTVDIVNAGTIPGKINLVSNTGIDSQYEDIIEYEVKYTNGKDVLQNDILNAGFTKHIRVRVYYKEDIDNNDLPSSDINLDMVLSITYTQSSISENNTGTLLQNLSSTNTCITKYNGQVTDRVGVTETATNVYFDKCADKRNIIFGGYCWQAIRTTQTGGLKLLYNGEPVDGKCESTRGNHKGIVQPVQGTSQNISSSYLYGSSFAYDTTNNTFTLIDTETAAWSDSTYENLIGKFTCKSTNDTCSTIYQINSYKSNTEAYVSSYTLTNTNYAQIGTSSFNANNNSLAMVGYMFNKIYNFNKKEPYKEYCGANTYSYGDSYTDNGNGTYTINNPTTIGINDWSANHTNVRNKYICKNPINHSCSDVWYVLYTTEAIAYYNSISDIYKYGSGFTYENGSYTLNGEVVSYWNFGDENYLSSLNNHHYTCFNSSGVCSSISYVYYYYYYQFGSLNYISLVDGKSINDAINEMLYDNDVNIYNSSIKGIIDNWYANNLLNKTSMLENVVYCNSREIIERNGWDSNGGNVNAYLYFDKNHLHNSSNLECSNIMDQFSVDNNSAKLIYPVFLIEEEELNYFGDDVFANSLRKTGSKYWLSSPNSISSYAYNGTISEMGNVFSGSSFNSSSNGIRPVVSLSSENVIASGSGSETDPWIVE